MKNANPVSGAWRWWLALALACGLAGCARSEAPKAAPKSLDHRFEFRLGERTVRLQVAVRLPEMQRGLMGRRELGADEGMLFVYTKPDRLSFWMRNTPLPLDIGYFDAAGELKEIYPLLPFDEAPVASRGDRLQFALEMNQGWYARNEVRPGSRLDLKAVAEALRERGFEPRKFGLE